MTIQLSSTEKTKYKINVRVNTMSRITKVVILVLIAFLVAYVKSSGQDRMKLTVDQAVEIGLKNSKTLHSSLMRVEGAKAKASEVNASRLPSLRLSAAYRRLSPIDPFAISTPFGNFTISPSILDNYSTQLTLNQPLFTGFRLSNVSEAADQSANAVKADYNKDKEEVRFNIKNAYWNLYKAQKLKAVIDENVEQTKAHLADAENMLKVGMATQNDVLKLQVQLSNVMYGQVEADNGVKLAMVALDNVMSIPLNTEIEIASVSEYNSKEYSELNGLVNKAKENRPEIKSASYMIKASEANVNAAQAGWYPQVSLVGNYYYSKPNSRVFPAENKFKDTWDVGVNLSMSVWDWMTTSHQTEEAEAVLEQSKDALGTIKDAITLEVTQNYLNLQQAKQKISISELAVKQATENNRITGEKFKSGLALSSDVIDAEVALLTANTNYTNALVDYEVAKARLDKSIGE